MSADKVKVKMEKVCLEELRAVEILGRGAMGTVFLVVKNSDYRLMALKVISKSATKNCKVNRIQIELDILSSLHHPFLCSVQGIVETERITGILEEYCPGGDLHQLRQKQPEKNFSESIIRFYAAEIVIALEHLHNQGIAYRDLKPENILIQASGHIMLTDFDLSKRLSPKQFSSPLSASQKKQKTSESKLSPWLSYALSFLFSCRSHSGCSLSKSTSKTHDFPHISQTHETCSSNFPTKSNSILGTEEYVSPEMLRGTGHDFAVDWWALGILLYEMLYGKTPFKGTTRKETFYNILIKNAQFKGPSTPLRDLIIRLLEKNPSRRLGSLNGAQDIKRHQFFEDLTWDNINCVSRPPFLPVSCDLITEMVENKSSHMNIEELVGNNGKKTNSNNGGVKNPKNWVDRLSRGQESDDFVVF